MYRPGDVIHAKYTIEKELSKHGLIASYMATDPDGKQFVLRCMHLEDTPDWSAIGRFESTARFVRRLNHPGLSPVIDFFEDEESSSYCLVRKFVPGVTLSESAGTGAGSVETAGMILEQTIDVLAYFHSFTPPVIHGSIRPEHIVVTPPHRATLIWNDPGTDFDDRHTDNNFPRLKIRDIRDLGLSVLSYISGVSYEDLAYADPYSSGMVPEPRGRIEKIIQIMIRKQEGSSGLGAQEIKRLFSSPRSEETGKTESLRDNSGPDDIPFNIDEHGSVQRRLGNVRIDSSSTKDVLTVGFPDDEKTENQLVKFALGTWLKWPWAVILILSAISGGALFGPLFIFWLIPPSRKFIKKLYSRFSDSRVTIDSETISVFDQLPPYLIRNIYDIRIKRKVDEHNRISLDFIIYDRKGQENTFSVHHLSPEQADAVSDFIVRRIEERKRSTGA